MKRPSWNSTWMHSAIAGFCIAALVGCDGVRGASNFAKRQAFNAKFEQIPLVEPKTSENRTLQMFVFTDNGVSVVRNGYNVGFSAAVELR